MGNFFANKKPAAKSEVEEDFVGGGGLLDTDVYSATIKYAYLSKAANSDARALNLCLIINKQEVTRQIWMTNRNGDVTYNDKKSGQPKNLPGYNQVNALCMLLASKDVGNMEMEDKVLKLYDYESQKDINQSVPCFEELHGLNLQVAIQRQTVDKTEKNESTGTWEPNGETRDVNEFVKFFPAEVAVTLGEIAQKISSLGADFDDVLTDGNMSNAIGKMSDEDGVWAQKWLEKNRGETWNRSKGKAEGKAFGGAKSSGGDERKAKSSVFDD